MLKRIEHVRIVLDFGTFDSGLRDIVARLCQTDENYVFVGCTVVVLTVRRGFRLCCDSGGFLFAASVGVDSGRFQSGESSKPLHQPKRLT